MEIKDYITINDNFLELKQISSLVKWLNNQKFEEAHTISGLQKNIRSAANFQLHYSKDSLTNVHWYNFLIFKIKQLVINYDKSLFTNAAVTQVNDVIALKYEKGDYYKVHTDNHTTHHRTLSVIIFLNDDYSGGSVSFHCAKTNKEILNVPPKAGRVVIFPSNFLFPHTVNNVKEGVRYSIVSWIN